jgi:hypothetical protein
MSSLPKHNVSIITESELNKTVITSNSAVLYGYLLSAFGDGVALLTFMDGYSTDATNIAVSQVGGENGTSVHVSFEEDGGIPFPSGLGAYITAGAQATVWWE